MRIPVHFIAYHQQFHGIAPQVLQIGKNFFKCHAPGHIPDVQQHCGLFHLVEGALYPDGFNLVLCLADTRCVHQPELYAVDVEYFLDGVAGGAGYVGNDGACLVEQGVEQGGFAGVGSSGNNGGDTGFNGIPE
jgi:hypothetical protein